eukprot:2238382-Rhodomonas_salina.1
MISSTTYSSTPSQVVLLLKFRDLHLCWATLSWTRHASSLQAFSGSQTIKSRKCMRPTWSLGSGWRTTRCSRRQCNLQQTRCQWRRMSSPTTGEPFLL